ncbi:hypothetical protein [Nostoc sp. PA-18-2419]|uniref:hypothetical protein n=1 Tax=Nostoc sp. PA-18-2419 TaxID=2575443 RepID=UPI001677F09F|nr:hypothetical protein [Nostoc sp. PA-18-2419]
MKNNITINLFNTLQDPTNGLDELLLELVDASQVINQNFSTKEVISCSTSNLYI